MTTLAQPTPLPGWSLAPFGDFGEACEAVLAHLHRTLPLETWVVARVDAGTTVILACAGSADVAGPGDTFPWSGSISARMLADRGPRVVVSLADVETYATAPVAREHGIAAYVGMPLCRADGTLFGILAGFSRTPADPAIAEATGLVELLARLLGAQLSAELRESNTARSDSRAAAAEMNDGVTGVGNSTYWNQIVAAEESRCSRYGDRAAVVVVELADYDHVEAAEGDDAAHVLLRRAARVLRSECREEDFVARIAGGTFAVLSVGADEDGVAVFAARVEEQLAANDALASVGFAPREARSGLHAAWDAAVASLPAAQRRLA